MQMWSTLQGQRKHKLKVVTPCPGFYYTPQPYQTLHVFNMSISRFTVYSFQFYQQSLGPGLEFSEFISLPLLKTLETGEDCMSEKLTTGENILEERL